MDKLHSLLNRQIRRHFGKDIMLPIEFTDFLTTIDKAYKQFDEDRLMLERSMELSSRELLDVNVGLQAMFKAWPDIFIRIDFEGKILECQTSNDADFFVNPSLLLRKKIQDIPSPIVRRLFEEAIQKVQQSNCMITIEYSLNVKKEERYFEARMVPMKNREIMVVIRNITDQKNLEKQLVQSGKMSAIGQLASGVAHEINNPLGVILGFAQSLKADLEKGDPKHFPIDYIEKEANRCRELVQNLLTFSRVSQPNDREEMDFSEMVESCLLLINAQGRAKNIEIKPYLQTKLPHISANKNQIQQIMINLCNNAMDAMPNGGTLTIEAKTVTKKNRDWVELCITDTGMGIPKELQGRIFEPFFTTKEVGKGTGLGLSLVYGILEKHGGNIKFETKENKGTVFKLNFPALQKSSKENKSPSSFDVYLKR